MKPLKNNYNNEERLIFATEVANLIAEYNEYRNNNDQLNLYNTRNDLGNHLLYLVYSVLPICKVKHYSGKRYTMEQGDAADCITKTILTILDKLENNQIDTTDYDLYPEKLISFTKKILEGQLLNDRRKEVEKYEEHPDTFDENGERIDNNVYVVVESLGSEEDCTKEDKQYYAAVTIKEENPIIAEKKAYLMYLLERLKEHDKYGKYIDLIFIDEINGIHHSLKEVGEKLGVSDSYASRMKKEIISLVEELMKEHSFDD